MMLEVKNIQFSYSGSEKVLQNISFSLSPGEVIGIAGKSGSGKTTLLKIIYGLLDPSSGSVIFKKEKVRGPSLELVPGHPKMKMVAQHFDLLPDHTVKENIEHRLLSYKKSFREEKAEMLLKLCGIWEQRNQKPATLSGGQKQLVAISCALAEEPELLLLDEPFSHLDHSTRNEILRFLAELKSVLGFSMIFISHDSSDVLQLSDRVMIMKAGSVERIASPEEIYYHPKNDYQAELFGSFNKISKSTYVRPSAIRICQSHKSKFSGVISAISFRGELTEYKVKSQGGKVIYFINTQSNFPIGKKVHLTW
ncbi:MAG: ABC transporter ATP-binding protein [Flavobacteriales bacterium]|nr:ABC transporter ATP-binding protein [Flavobacteriales bacterium]